MRLAGASYLSVGQKTPMTTVVLSFSAAHRKSDDDSCAIAVERAQVVRHPAGLRASLVDRRSDDRSHWSRR